MQCPCSKFYMVSAASSRGASLAPRANPMMFFIWSSASLAVMVGKVSGSLSPLSSTCHPTPLVLGWQSRLPSHRHCSNLHSSPVWPFRQHHVSRTQSCCCRLVCLVELLASRFGGLLNTVQYAAVPVFCVFALLQVSSLASDLSLPLAVLSITGQNCICQLPGFEYIRLHCHHICTRPQVVSVWSQTVQRFHLCVVLHGEICACWTTNLI